MPWVCRFHEQRPSDWKVGDMWYRTDPVTWKARVEEWRARGADRDDAMVVSLSDSYLQDTIDQRPPLLVYLPGEALFCLDSCPSRAGSDRSGWQVSGSPPQMTVSPSINCIGSYHGWLRDGVISDDVDGHRYDAEGRLMR